ncbi:MAG: hypothetical protein RL329_3056 [Bacteroidota bacterium]
MNPILVVRKVKIVGLMDVRISRISRISRIFMDIGLKIRENSVKSVKSVHPSTQQDSLE